MEDAAPDTIGHDLDEPNTAGAPSVNLTIDSLSAEASVARRAEDNATNSRGQNGNDGGQHQPPNRGPEITRQNQGAAVAGAGAAAKLNVIINNYNNCSIRHGPSPTINQGVACEQCHPESAEPPEVVVVSEDESEGH